MSQYDNTNTGTLFVNDRKQTDKHPDRTGSGTIECPYCQGKFEVWISGWIKTARDGVKKFLSLSFKRKDTNGGNQDRSEQRRPEPPASDDEQPF